LGNSIAETNWSGTAQDNVTARENFRRSEITAMNQDALENPSMATLDYLNSSVAGPGVGLAQSDSRWREQEMARITSQAQDPWDYSASGEIRIEINGVGSSGDKSGPVTWSPTGMPDNSPLRIVGQSADGGWIWNTGATSYPVPTPDIEVRPLGDIAETGSIRPIGAVEGFLTFNPLGRAIVGVGDGLKNTFTGLVESGKQTVLTVNDAINYGLSRLDNALGGDFAYAPQSTLGRSVQVQGAGNTALNVVGGLVQGTVGTALQPINALYRQDAQMFGESLPGAALMAAPLLRAGTVAEIGANAEIKALSGAQAFDGALYPDAKLRQLVNYLERRNVSVFGTEGNPTFIARADGSGQMLLPANPTELQVKHELSHYLDFKNMGFEAYRDLGRTAREVSVLERLQGNRLWPRLNQAEQDFSVNYVNRLLSAEALKNGR
jgi:hypothetical protein